MFFILLFVYLTKIFNKKFVIIFKKVTFKIITSDKFYRLSKEECKEAQAYMMHMAGSEKRPPQTL